MYFLSINLNREKSILFFSILPRLSPRVIFRACKIINITNVQFYTNFVYYKMSVREYFAQIVISQMRRSGDPHHTQYDPPLTLDK